MINLKKEENEEIKSINKGIEVYNVSTIKKCYYRENESGDYEIYIQFIDSTEVVLMRVIKEDYPKDFNIPYPNIFEELARQLVSNMFCKSIPNLDLYIDEIKDKISFQRKLRENEKFIEESSKYIKLDKIEDWRIKYILRNYREVMDTWEDDMLEWKDNDSETWKYNYDIDKFELIEELDDKEYIFRYLNYKYNNRNLYNNIVENIINE